MQSILVISEGQEAGVEVNQLPLSTTAVKNVWNYIYPLLCTCMLKRASYQPFSLIHNRATSAFIMSHINKEDFMSNKYEIFVSNIELTSV
jgi:hypothetical protein